MAGILDDVNQFILSHVRVGSPGFWILCLLGGSIFGVLPDLDHVPKYVFGLPIPGRLLHPVLFVIGCAGLSRFGRLYFGLVLEEKSATAEEKAIESLPAQN